MKKILAVLAAVVLAMAMSITTFAWSPPATGPVSVPAAAQTTLAAADSASLTTASGGQTFLMAFDLPATLAGRPVTFGTDAIPGLRAGMRVNAWHLGSGGAWTLVTTVTADSVPSITVTFPNLSTVAFTVAPATTAAGTRSPQTGVATGAFALVLGLAAVGGVVVFGKKKN